MFIKSIDITNYKLFKDTFSMYFNVPDGVTKGSGLTILCGENGNGKSSILESLLIPKHSNADDKMLNNIFSDKNSKT